MRSRTRYLAVLVGLISIAVGAYLVPRFRVQMARTRHRQTLGRLAQWSEALKLLKGGGLSSEPLDGKEAAAAREVTCRVGWTPCGVATFYDARLIREELEKKSGLSLEPLDAWENPLRVGLSGNEYVVLSLGKDNRPSPEIPDYFRVTRTDGDIVYVNGNLKLGPEGITRPEP